MVRIFAFIGGLAFSFHAAADAPPSPPETGTISQHIEWSRKFVHEPDTTGSLAGGTSSDVDMQQCTPGTRVFDRLPFDSWQLKPAC
jgi:hypothetical protein